jgi:hypothetical protein
MAARSSRRGLKNCEQNPKSKRSAVRRLGARWRQRCRIRSCCFKRNVLSENGSGSASTEENGQSGQQMRQQYDLGWTFAVLVLIAGRFIARRKHYQFCFVVACVDCIFMPFETALGVLTILALNRRSVKE